MRRHKAKIAIAALAAIVATVAALLATSCSSTPPNVPIRTFERAQRVDFVCMKVLDDKGGGACQQDSDCNAYAGSCNNGTCLVYQPPVPVEQSLCTPVGSTTNGGELLYHLYAVVTQTLRGEVAVVDLTGGFVVDTSATTPGINFLPVGQLPTDVAAAPDGQMVFVGAAEVNKPAIYGIPSNQLLGDSRKYPGQTVQPAVLSSWPVCALPQAPGNIVVVPTSPSADGGTPSTYQLVVTLPGNAVESAKIVTLDPARFTDGTYPRGQLAPCVFGTKPIELDNVQATTWSPGPAWPDGVPYVDGGIDLFQPATLDGGSKALRMPLPLADCVDAAAEAGDAGDGGAFSLRPTPGTHAHPSSLAVSGTTIYVGDDELPIIHVFDASKPALQLMPPLLVTSALEPARVVTTKQVAVSPSTRDYKRYLYAIDHDEGSLIVYDITDPVNSPHVPLSKPHPELNPFQPPDRILFGVPVSAVEFIRHDFPLGSCPTCPSPATAGLLCDPNPAEPTDPGANYANGAPVAAGGGGAVLPLGPLRLRGVFAMATLSNAQVATIDVDDWDAPCRRPTFLGAPTLATNPSGISIPAPTAATKGVGDLAIAQVNGSGAYAAENAYNATTDLTSAEWYFPVSQPHRARSNYLVTSNSTSGVHVPNILGVAQLYENGALATGSARDAVLLGAPDKQFVDPYACDPTSSQASCTAYVQSKPSVRISFEDPQVAIDQDWQLTFEGPLPNLSGLAATVAPSDPQYSSLVLGITGGGLCRKGIEDARLGHLRYDQMATAAKSVGLDPKAVIGDGGDSRLGDYVQLTDDMLGGGTTCSQTDGCAQDPYWTETNSCWEGPLASDGPVPAATGLARWDQCNEFFGASGSTQSPARDLPILEAYDDHLVVAQFSYKDPKAATPSGHWRNGLAASSVMRLAQCCFHNQVHFNVRTGGEWVAIGSKSGYLHHVIADETNACVFSCEKRETLLSSRVAEVFTLPASSVPARNSPFALRNPFFSAFMQATGTPRAVTDPVYDPKVDNGFTFSMRDAVWKVSLRGGFTNQLVNLATTTISVVPQSMRFIPALSDLAIVDGSAQGLILIDLNTLTIAHNPYF